MYESKHITLSFDQYNPKKKKKTMEPRFYVNLLFSLKTTMFPKFGSRVVMKHLGVNINTPWSN